VSTLRERVGQAIAAGQIGERLWLYATYHCNLTCTYCLTESSPRIANRRTMTCDAMLVAGREAKALGLTCLGVTGGEVFMLPWFPEALAEMGAVLPVVALTNATLFTGRMLDRVQPLAGLDVALQISLDSDEPDRNDQFRGPDNFAKVVDAIPKLLDRGIHVRIATTVEYQTDDELTRVCDLHRRLGISDDDHVVRCVVHRGRAAIEGMGVDLEPGDVLPELTLSTDGAFLHPFAPTVRHGRTDLDLLVSHQTAPLEYAMSRFLRITSDLPAGADAARNIR
jgi:MoaA/NifB/PqqE/SkfB family radical SAM enzyme